MPLADQTALFGGRHIRLDLPKSCFAPTLHCALDQKRAGSNLPKRCAVLYDYKHASEKF